MACTNDFDGLRPVENAASGAGGAGPGSVGVASGFGGTTGSGGASTTGADAASSSATSSSAVGSVGASASSAASGAGGSGGAPVTTIPCGGDTCDLATQSCCATLSGFSCISKGGPCVDGITIDCTNAATCGAGQVCCAGFGAAQCAGDCDRGFQLCATDAECDGEPCETGYWGLAVCGGLRPGR
jgi:hypothetical protein